MRVKSYQRVFLFLLFVLLITSLLSPWLAWLWSSIIEAHPPWQEYRQPFSRIFNRCFMILAIVLFFSCYRSLHINSMNQLGLTPFREGYGDLFRGFSLALVSFVGVLLTMWMFDIFKPGFRLSFGQGLERIVKALLTAVTVGFLEEIFFRGMIFKGLLEDTKPPIAFVAASVFYSAIHFVKPAEKIYLEGLHPWAGIHNLGQSFHQFFDPATIFPGFMGFFLIGIVVSYAFYRTRSLYLSMGLHGGWVFGIKSVKIFGHYSKKELGWLFGGSSPRFVTGVATWIGVLAVAAVVYWMTRNRTTLSSDPPPPKAA